MKKSLWSGIRVAALFLTVLACRAAEPAVSVANVAARQRYPWNGLVDIDFEVQYSDASADMFILLIANDRQAGRPLPVNTLSLAGATFTNGISTVRAGKYRVTWDAGRDAPGTVSSDVSFAVGAGMKGASPLYVVIDLSGGTNAVSYPVEVLHEVPAGGWPDEYKTTKLVLRRMEAGTFMMGSPPDELGRKETEELHQVTLTSPFYIGVFEVTQRQWELILGSHPNYFVNSTCYAMRPVDCATYDMIRGDNLGAEWPYSGAVDPDSFMGTLRAKTGITAFDLPTEAEWEYACRAGTTNALNSGKELSDTNIDANVAEVGRYLYNGGLSGCFNRLIDTGGGTAAVGSYRPNDWGLYDIARERGGVLPRLAL